MSIRARPLLAVLLGLVAPAAAVGQEAWVPHQPPCKLSTGHYLINGSQLHLKIAVESRFPEQRAGRLKEARAVLHRAILEAGQAENPAAWYYLGRTYAEQRDLVGADSAFRRAVALAQGCAGDVVRHTARLAALALNDALRAWNGGQRDSARAFLELARSLDASDAEIPFYACIIYATAQEPDSAARFLEIGRALAQTDTAHQARARQAALEVARAYETRAYQRTRAPTLAQTRAHRDSTARRMARDSALLVTIMTEVGGIRARGQRLNPPALAAFQRDSTILATRLAADGRALDSLRTQAVTDSAAAAPDLDPAVRSYTAYLERYPEDAEMAIPLLRLHAAAGDRTAVDSAARRVAASPHASGTTLVQAGLNLYRDAFTAPAALLLEAALARNPYDHTALSVVTYVYHAEGRAAPLLESARRRFALAPLDPGAARAMALGWDLAGQPDSVARYLALADTGLGWNVHVSQFTTGQGGTSLSGYVVNVGPAPRPATELVFEFLDPGGAARFGSTVPIPALEPRARAPIALRLPESGAASWRYRQP